jgi:hypothetical protein
MPRFSRVGYARYFDPERFQWVSTMEVYWQTIRDGRNLARDCATRCRTSRTSLRTDLHTFRRAGEDAPLADEPSPRGSRWAARSRRSTTTSPGASPRASSPTRFLSPAARPSPSHAVRAQRLSSASLGAPRDRCTRLGGRTACRSRVGRRGVRLRRSPTLRSAFRAGAATRRTTGATPPGRGTGDEGAS